MPSGKTCPVCHNRSFTITADQAQVAHDNQLRARFARKRLGHEPDGLEAMDLTRFMHGGPGRLLCCDSCGMHLREEEGAGQYENDAYDSRLLKHLYPRYLKAFEEKLPWCRPLLRDGAEVVEVGSHLGSFLQAAETWGWRHTGLDIGHATSRFAQSQGVSVKRLAMEDYSPRLRAPEAIFIWNCFEQMADAASTLRAAHRLLDRDGRLILRVPNVEFYHHQHRLMELQDSAAALQNLGYNNLLGFPYLYGYSPATLVRLLRANGFEPLACHNSSLLTPPYPELSSRTRKEWKDTKRGVESAPGIQGAWIEVVSRRLDAN